VKASLVVDASVGIKLFVEEELSDQAEAVFRRLDDDDPPHFYVPDLFFIECANILWKYVRRAAYPREEALRDIADLLALPLQPVSGSALLPAALALAIERGLTSYDASYATLASNLGSPLITADRPLLQKLAGSGIDVQWLGDVTL
jgi:predicted nucleic acid-binding protein